MTDLVQRAYEHGNAAQYLLVKGSTDYIMNQIGLLYSVDRPSVESMEAIGGTGDTLTGIATALISTGMNVPEASYSAAKINRIAGLYADPTPATQVIEIINQIPQVVENVLKNDHEKA